MQALKTDEDIPIINRKNIKHKIIKKFNILSFIFIFLFKYETAKIK